MRRRRRIRSFILIFLLLIIATVTVFAYYVFKINSIEGHYKEECNLTDIVISNIDIWLSDIDGYDKDYSWIKSKSNDFIVNIDVDITKTDFGKGEYTINVDEASYIKCQIASRELMANCLKDIIKEKLINNGIDENIDDSELDSLIVEVLGLNLYDFIALNDLTIMSSYEDYSKSINRSGNYSADFDTVKGFLQDSSAEEKYYIDKSVLMLSESNMILRKEATDEK